jgi:hypothetical protein
MLISFNVSWAIITLSSSIVLQLRRNEVEADRVNFIPNPEKLFKGAANPIPPNEQLPALNG